MKEDRMLSCMPGLGLGQAKRGYADTACLLVDKAKPSKQNHMAETKEEEMSTGWWLQKLKPWTAGFH
ncbi:hypothetical protein GW7_21153 [Heterocephalus glaber]|uniref:Uncharacterized protein n=1 Tax=Heterocephalus glaber TaxID=10181 RepID=G5AQ35_HETGA|nr:hypothetical protein GW7_21153 [Heterocephalus glaber]